ncbi:hypothetical protein I4674_02460 [Proteus mirabilis]|nr:hypothetical protein [Proteus mirabilis]
MKVSEIQPVLSSFIDNVDNEINKKFGLINNISYIGNTNVPFDKGKGEVITKKTTLEYITGCQNLLDRTKCDSYNTHLGNFSEENKENVVNENIDEFEIDKYFNQIMESAGSIINLDNSTRDAIDSGSDLKKENINIKEDFDKKEHIDKKLPDFITNKGLKELNVNEKLFFQEKKKRSFKNLLKPLFSPFQFINRNILSIDINYTNFNVNKKVYDFNLHSEKDGNKSASIFSNRLNILNKTFTENTNEVIKRKRNNNKLDNAIKYHTLERALECKFINDIKILKGEFIDSLAKDKFEKNFSSLPFNINNKLDDILNGNLMEINEIKKEIFSKNSINELKKELKDMVNDLGENINVDNIIEKTFNSFVSEENRKEITSDSNNDFNTIKENFSLILTKELFKQLSKNKDFIGEEIAISEIDELINVISGNIYKNIAEVKGDIISELKNGLYKNIKNDKENDNLLIRLFKNSSNNINYKWAQDAIILFISYESFEHKGNVGNEGGKVINNENEGVKILGGNGSNIKKNTMIENDLKKIFNRLGLHSNNLDESKDEVLRKYFANYFKHI